MQRTPLYDRLKEYPAKWVPFGGWEMPVEFGGILKEHRCVRQGAGLFDLSHMGELDVIGRDVDEAVAHVQRLVTNDIASLEPGAARYTAVCRPDGGILDDIIVYRSAKALTLVVNASNTSRMFEWFSVHAPVGVRIKDRTLETALIALQGPKAAEILRPLSSVDVDALRFYHFEEGLVGNVPCVVSRTGYTGEDGFELYTHESKAVELWDTLIAAGAPHGIAPIGLGARDTLRLEACYALYGNEIDEDHNPLEAGLGWVVKLQKGDFIGREALLEIKQRGLSRTLVGLTMEDRGVPRHGFELLHQDRPIGVVTSGTFSPTLEHAVALGYVEKEFKAPGTEVDVKIRNSAARAKVAKTPFYRGSVKH